MRHKQLLIKKISLQLAKVFIVLAIFAISQNLTAQDPHFSLFNQNQLFLNPANTGNFLGDWRIGGNYRNQWSSIGTPYNTTTLSYDQQFYVFNLPIGGGAYFMNDNAGSPGMMYNKLYFSGGYGQDVFNNYLRVGVQIGFAFASLDNNQIFPSQWDDQQQTYNPDLPSDANIGNILYPDVNLGFLWKRNIRRLEPEVGVSFQHVNVPNISYLGGKERLPVRLQAYTNIKTNINDEYFITPTLYYASHKGAQESMMGLTGGKNMLGSKTTVKKVNAGFFVRNGIFDDLDAMAIMAGARVGRLDIWVNYDINLSGLSEVSSGRGAFEISFVYRSISTLLNSYSIPCERY